MSIVLYCIVLCCVVLCCVVLYCIALHCIALHCIALHCIVLYCIVLYCIVLYCIVLYCIVLYCIVPGSTKPCSWWISPHFHNRLKSKRTSFRSRMMMDDASYTILRVWLIRKCSDQITWSDAQFSQNWSTQDITKRMPF